VLQVDPVWEVVEVVVAAVFLLPLGWLLHPEIHTQLLLAQVELLLPLERLVITALILQLVRQHLLLLLVVVVGDLQAQWLQ